MDEPETLRLVRLEFKDLQVLYLFGSYAGGEIRPDSDIDLALLLPHDTANRIGPLALTNLQLSLEKTLKRNVDLVNLRDVSTVLQYEIVNTGKVLYCQDDFERHLFENFVWSCYQKLNEERAEVLEEGLKTGRFYAI